MIMTSSPFVGKRCKKFPIYQPTNLNELFHNIYHPRNKLVRVIMTQMGRLLQSNFTERLDLCRSTENFSYKNFFNLKNARVFFMIV